MMYFELISGGILIGIAIICLIGAIAEEEAGLLLVIPIFGVVGGFLFASGVGRNESHGAAAHRALFQAATAQGYPVHDDDVYSGYSPSIDVHVGRCLFGLMAEKVDGRWRFGVAESGLGSSGGIVFLSPAAVAKFAEVCP